MSFVMIATGVSSSKSRVRTLSIRSLLLGGGVAATLLLSAGVGVGWWISSAKLVAPPPKPEKGRGKHKKD